MESNFNFEIERRYRIQEEYLGNVKPINQISTLVSVKTTTYNHVGYIRKCLEGILNQKTDFAFEVVIGDDGSDDGTTEVCKSFALKHPDKIRLFLRDRNTSQLFDNSGKLVRRLNGFFTYKACRGKYIAICEGDDYWTDPLKLQKQVDYLEANPEAHFTFHHSSIKKGGLIVGKRPKSGSGVLKLEHLLFRKTYPTMSLLYRNSDSLYKDLVHLRKEFQTGDFLLVLLLASRGPGYLFPDNMGVYRVHSGGIYSPLGEIKKLRMGIQNRRAALKHIPMNFKQKMICRLMILLRQSKILYLKTKNLFKSDK